MFYYVLVCLAANSTCTDFNAQVITSRISQEIYVEKKDCFVAADAATKSLHLQHPDSDFGYSCKISNAKVNTAKVNHAKLDSAPVGLNPPPGPRKVETPKSVSPVLQTSKKHVSKIQHVQHPVRPRLEYRPLPVPCGPLYLFTCYGG